MELVEGQEGYSLSGSYSLLQTNGGHSCLDTEAGSSLIVSPGKGKRLSFAG